MKFLRTHGKNTAPMSQLLAPNLKNFTETKMTKMRTLKMRTTRTLKTRTTKMRRKRTTMPPLPKKPPLPKMPRNELYVQTEALDSTSVYKRSLTRSFDYHYNWPLGQLIF